MSKRIGVWRILGCVAVALLTLEALARLDDHLSYGAPLWGHYDADLITMRDQYGLTGRPNGHYVRWYMNSWGYRGPEPRSGTVRIVCLGASETFGMREDNGREYPRQLEEQLNQRLRTRAIEVINLGLPGASMRDTVGHLKQIMDRYHPDLVTIYPSPAPYVWRIFDFDPSQVHVSRQKPPAQAVPVKLSRFRTYRRRLGGIYYRVVARARKLPRYVWYRMNMVDLSQLRLEARAEDLSARVLPAGVLLWWRRWRADGRASAFQLPLMERLPEKAVDLFRRDVTTTVEFLKSRGVPVVLATHAQRYGNHVSDDDRLTLAAWRYYYPQLKEDGFLDMEQRMSQATREIARDEGIPLADAARAVPPGPRYFGDLVHFSNAGAERMAALLAEKLAPAVESSLQRTRSLTAAAR